MRNIKLIIEYDGGRYDGWQRLGKEESKNTIENKIVEVLEKLTGEPVELFVGMRTEKGVHAHYQVANFKTDIVLKPIEIRNYLNRYLPMDIAVVEVSDEQERFHSALNAKSKTFLYRIDVRDVYNVFDRKYTYYSFAKLDVKKMNEVAEVFLGEHDFKAFSTVKKNKNTIKKIYAIDIYGDNEEVSITIKANDYLHNMARLIIGALIEAGNGRISAKDIGDMLAGNKEVNILPAETNGMFLENIEY